MTTKFLRKPTTREIRLGFLLIVVIAMAAWKFIPRPWHPTVTLETAHYHIDSTAAREQVEEIGRVVEFLYTAYSNRLHTLPNFQKTHPKLKLRLYKDSAEFRSINPTAGWAEAFYSEPLCHAYYSAREINPYHWMLHEATHQLNSEVAKLDLEKWLEEGVADYFSSSRVQSNQLAVGRIDFNTYPYWHIENMATAASLDQNLKNGSVIALRAIITNDGGPSMNSHFNSYYLHWWTLTHFLFENPKSRPACLKLLEKGGDLKSFEQLIGPVEQIQDEWHQFVRRLKAAEKNDKHFLKTGELLEPSKPGTETLKK